MLTPKYDAKTKTYNIRISLNIDKKRIQKYKSGFKTKKEAFEWARRELDKNNKNIILEFNTFYQLIDYFLSVKKASNLAPVTIADYEYYLNKIKNELGNIYLNQITTPFLQEYINKFQNKSCLQKHIKQTLSALFTLAYNQNIIETNPFSKIIKPKYIQKEINIYDAKTIQNLLKIIKNEYPKYYSFTILLSVFGLRPNEATALVEDDIVLKDNQYFLKIDKSISIVKNKVSGEKNEYIKEPKSNAGKRLLPIDLYFINELHYYKESNAIKSEYLVCDINGNRITLNAYEQAIERIAYKHGLPKITPYGLRHSFGNMNKSLGNDSYTVSRLMGHSDPSITLKYYYHDDSVLNKSSLNKIFDTIKIEK